jgi:hypothetical protein
MPVTALLTPFPRCRLGKALQTSQALFRSGGAPAARRVCATERLIARFGLVSGALVLGIGWAVWHYPSLVEVHRGLDWISW